MTPSALECPSSTCTSPRCPAREIVIDPFRIYNVNERDPEDRKGWSTQHDALKFTEPPYVYHVVSHAGAVQYVADECSVKRIKRD